MTTEDLIRALELERASGVLTRRWLDEGGRESAVFDILERHAREDDHHGQALWQLLVDQGVAPPETQQVESPGDYPTALIGLKEELLGVYERLSPELPLKQQMEIGRIREEDDDQRALLRVYFLPEEHSH